MIPPFAWVGEFVPFFLRWGNKSQHVCHNVHKKSLARSLFYTCIYFELTKHLGCGFKVLLLLLFVLGFGESSLTVKLVVDLHSEKELPMV